MVAVQQSAALDCNQSSQVWGPVVLCLALRGMSPSDRGSSPRGEIQVKPALQPRGSPL